MHGKYTVFAKKQNCKFVLAHYPNKIAIQYLNALYLYTELNVHGVIGLQALTQVKEIGRSRETLLQQTCSKQVPDSLTLGGSHSVVNAHRTWLTVLRENARK